MSSFGWEAVRRRSAVALVCMVALTGGSWAQEEGAADVVPYDPPALSGEDASVDFLDAVRFTLDNDPALLTRKEDVESRFGRFQESSGAFDTNFTGRLQWEHRVQELTESVKKGEQDRRDGLFEAGFVACGLESDLEQKIKELDLVLGGGNSTDITTDDGLQAQLRIIEALIAGADSKREEELLMEARQNLLETERIKTEEARVLAEGACNEANDTLERLGAPPEEEEFDIGRLDLRFQKLTRGGATWTPFLRSAYNSTEYVDKRDGFFVPAVLPSGEPLTTPSGIPLDRQIDFGGKNIDDFYSTEIGFEVNLPLLRNRGREAVAAGETAARIDWDASELLYRHAATESVLNTIFAYWNVVAAQEQIRIVERSAELQARVLEITQALIEAEELPGVEEARALAADASTRSQLEGARRDLIQAQMDLVTAMGLTATEGANMVTAETPFLEPPSAERLADLEQALVRMALADRLDIQASKALAESGRVLARAATINLKPRFDVTLGAWASARGEGSFSNATDKWTGPNWRSAGLIEKPIGNNAAKGRLVQSESLLRRRQISEADLERRVSIGVVRALNALDKALEELAYAAEAASQFEATFSAELEKLKLGETTVLDTTLTEQQRTRAQLALVSARFQVATLVAVLRFETGSLVVQDEGRTRITLQSLTGLPEARAQS